MKISIFSKNPSKEMLYFHGVMLPLLQVGGVAWFLYGTYNLPFTQLIGCAISVMIIWNIIYLYVCAQKAFQTRFIQFAAISVVPACLLSEKTFLGLLAIQHIFGSGLIDLLITFPVMFLASIIFIIWAVWAYWKTKTKENFQIFLFACFWTSSVGSIVLIIGLAAVNNFLSLYPSHNELLIIRVIKPLLALALMLSIVWCSWRIIKKWAVPDN